MARSEASGSLSPDLEAVRERIEEWRRTRAKRTRMAEDLWLAAAELARKHGVWATSRALRIRYDGLKVRLGAATGSSPEAAVFCNIGSMGSVAGTGGGTTTVVELSRADGARLTMRLASGASIDARSLMDAFCGAGR